MTTPTKKAPVVAPEANQPIESQILEGLAMYAFVHKPDPGNAKYKIPPAYKIEVQLDKPEQLKKAQTLGLKIREPDGEKFTFPYASFRSKVKEGRNPPRVMDSQRNLIDPKILVGNGSRVRVRFIPFEYGAGEITAVLQDTMVLDLVKYEPSPREGFLEVVPGGYVAASTEEPVA